MRYIRLVLLLAIIGACLSGVEAGNKDMLIPALATAVVSGYIIREDWN